MTGRRFPPPWSVEELDAMTRPTKSKMEAIKPEQQDFDAVEKEYGPLTPTASPAALAERYQLAQAAKVIRQLEQSLSAAKRTKAQPRGTRPQSRARGTAGLEGRPLAGSQETQVLEKNPITLASKKLRQLGDVRGG